MVQRIGANRLLPVARAVLVIAAIGAALANGHKWC
jgi:hypothetical protein